MRRLGSALLAVSLFAGCGASESEPSSEVLGRQQAPLTVTDVDVAPECQGIITFVNTASLQTLGAYVPGDTANNLVTRRTTSPFVTLADVASVPGVGSARLQQLEGGARAGGLIGPSCVGIQDELAISTDDEHAMVALVNSINPGELHAILPYAWNGATNLLNLRPFTSAQGISGTSGIGPVSFRNIRNAATLGRALEALVDQVNATPLPVGNRTDMALDFDWQQIVWDPTHLRYLESLECFGIDPALLPHMQEVSIRPNLADAAEVRADVEHAVSYANRQGHISQSVIDSGLADLDARIAGRTFKGCYLSWSVWRYWGMNNIAFFIDTQSGFSVMTETSWSE
ncbi:helix-hairpin-helix domain-containing protein [Pyxidicoccus xibeiensis]|uniref:helix-hairpin-helix domain-containing protein n=1 Tax=Pyxidicoccus xibeiensis TaxID=2906759 RepID=UPI0020A7E03E|nr:helix-hairpin-helix domain-containing protein [Pyxidicoccus xibeiensis]MCP3138211.1 helix-hairpin-helix domain-containing protein [Pyxidicoccus xibeiensis]